MGKAWGQFKLLLWKNLLLQKRQKILTFFEIAVPVILAVVILLVRQLVDSEPVEDVTTWKEFVIEDKLPQSLPPVFGRDSWALAFSPNNVITRNITQRTAQRLGMRSEGYGFSNEEALVDHIINLNASANDILMAVVFTNIESSLPDKIHYKIRPSSQQRARDNDETTVRLFSASDWYTSYKFPHFPPTGPREPEEEDGGEPGYHREGFLHIQRAIDLSIIEYTNSTADMSKLKIAMKRYPYPPYLDDYFVIVLQYQFSFILLLCFVVVAPNVTKDICLEKERKLKESMKLMGLNSYLHWMAWFFKYFCFVFVSCAFMTLFFHLDVGAGALLNYTHFTITFFFLLLWAISIIMFCFLISTFFSKANGGAAAGGILYLLTFVPMFFFLLDLQNYSEAARTATSLICNLAMGWGCTVIASYESIGVGVQWNNLGTAVSPDDTYTMLHCYLMLIADSVLYGILTWYFDNVLPGDYGIPNPWYFPFTKSYWCGSKVNLDEQNAEQLDYAKVPGIRAENFEDPPQGISPGLRIRNLRKEFSKDGAKKVAVENMCIDMYEGQITSLLGHNGAGKTTTMFMLTGFLRPTSGTAFIDGHDIRKDIESVRSSLGLCPQHDILFDTLTVHEHLTFFAKLKGCPDEKLDDEVEDMIKVLHLQDKRDVFSSSLSGGMKRKLSVGIALIAGSKIVILDEPTSGMDPEARRQAWEILQSQRKGRTMILSTHFMDEADLLGDRIAIMAEGAVQCYGSSLFLKNKYGAGYHMVMVKEPGCQSTKITNVIQKFAPEARLESNISSELSYVLPNESSSSFEALFQYLEDNKEELKISSFGASVTTMEEVFLQVAERCDETLEEYLQAGTRDVSGASKKSTSFDNAGYVPDELANGISLSKITYLNDSLPSPGTESGGAFNNAVEPDKILNGNATTHSNGFRDAPQDTHEVSEMNGVNHTTLQRTLSIEDELPPVFGKELIKNTGFKQKTQQFKAMFMKKFIHSKRNIIVSLVQILIPVVFTVLGCGITLAFPGPRDPPTIELKLWDDILVSNVYSNGLNHEMHEVSKYYSELASQKSTLVNIKDKGYSNMDEYLGDISEEDLDSFSRNQMVAATFSGMESSDARNATAHFNNQALHTTAISLNLMMNAFLQYFTDGKHTTVVENHPLPRSADQAMQEELDSNLTTGFIISWQISFGMSFVIGTFVIFLIKERATKSKHIQFVSGVHVGNYWLSTFLWDMINFIIPSVLLLLIFLAFDVTAYTDGDNLGYVFLLFFLFGWSVLPFTYLLSFMFIVASSGYVWITVFNIFTSTAASLAVSILATPGLGTENLAEALEWIFYIILPNFCFGRALESLYTNMETISSCTSWGDESDLDLFCRSLAIVNRTNPCCADNCGDRCVTWQTNVVAWDTPGIGRPLVFMAIQGFVFLIILFFIESGKAQMLTQKLCASSNTVSYDDIEDGLKEEDIVDDEDVIAEDKRINESQLKDLIQTDSLVLQNIQKFYDQFLAVDKLSVGIPQGECFGLLGVNGAGKTTTFKMLTGDESISTGNAFLGGLSVIDDIKRVQTMLGYCPQFDALIDQMTVRETLRMYSQLRGVQEEDIEDAVETLIKSLLLDSHADKQCGQLSGGNKRKVSTAIALIGDPPVIFLDEPTTGMDPMARRLLWDTLTKVRKSGRTLVLTSHSMEECEALCTRLAIMVNGKFRCLGSTQHLKNKFGEGYTLIAKVSTTGLSGDDGKQIVDQKLAQLKTFIENTFSGSVLKDFHSSMVHYQVPSADISWASIFGTMERAKIAYDIEDYSVSQTTLEEVFLGFARKQLPPRGEGLASSAKCKNCCKFIFCCKCCC